MNFIRQVLASCCGMAAGCGCAASAIIFFVSSLAGISTALNGARRAEQAPFSGGFLVVDLSAPIVEAPTSTDRFSALLLDGGNGLSIYDACSRIIRAASDDAVSGIILKGSFSGSGTTLAQASELRAHLEYFRESAKPVFAYLENPTLKDYYLASAATEIFINPMSDFEFRGVALNGVFIGNALKKYGLDAQVIKAGKYKSFGETFTSDKMSPESREAAAEIASGLWHNILEKISAARGIPLEDLEAAADKKGIMTAEEAVKAGFADATAYRDEFISKMTEIAGDDPSIGSFRQTDLLSYHAVQNAFGSVKQRSGDAIAILYLSGEIVDGFSRESGAVSSEFYCPLIRSLRDDDGIRGVVLRIDSPGGSAYASEQIRREVELLAAEKPVVASFGASAASGAYWIASAATKIVSQKNTLTGSIGVFGMKLSGGKLASGFGVTFDGVRTSKFADMDSFSRPLNTEEEAAIQRLVDATYEKFIDTVASGRKMSAKEVQKLAEGRVWLASSVEGTGLFDEIGGLSSALEICAGEAGMEPTGYPEIEQYPTSPTIGEMLVSLSYSGTPFAKICSAFIPDAFSYAAKALKTLENRAVIRAQQPFLLEIED